MQLVIAVSLCVWSIARFTMGAFRHPYRVSKRFIQMSDDQSETQPTRTEPSNRANPSGSEGNLDTVRDIVSGAIIGTSAGAAIGTLLFPVFGTFIGAVVGGSLNAYLRRKATAETPFGKPGNPYTPVSPRNPECDPEEKAKKP